MKRELIDTQAITGPRQVNQSGLHALHLFGAVHLLGAMVESRLCVGGISGKLYWSTAGYPWLSLRFRLVMYIAFDRRAYRFPNQAAHALRK